MKLLIILENAPQSELARVEVEVPPNKEGIVSAYIHTAIRDIGDLAPGDVIRIEEVES